MMSNTPDSLPDLKTRCLLLTNNVMVSKVHDGWRVGNVWKRVLFGGCDRRYTVLSTVFLGVVCLTVLLEDARPVSSFESPKERSVY